MHRRLIAALTVCFALGAAPALANHDTSYQWGEKEYPVLNPAMKNVKLPTFVGGPCTGVARQAMPAGDGHDHLSLKQHKFECGASKVFFDDLVDELSPRPDVVTGEMDIKGNLMVVGVAYPESGFLLYDISNPAQPKFLSHYRGSECEQLALDVDCGAYVDLSPTGDRVYMAVQQTTVLPMPSANIRPVAIPGVEVIDISIPTLPISLGTTPVVSVGGVHTVRSFMVPEAGGDGPREPGEYTVSVANGQGLALHQVQAPGVLIPVSTIDIGETHDTFIQEDPILKRTLLYANGGFSTGFYVWDITAPSAPVPLGEWDPTPECTSDWYSHTIDVSVKNGKRILTVPNELIDFFGTQEDPDNCGALAGNGDHVGTMWFVDITDLSKLAPFGNDGTHAPDEEIKAKSEPLLSSVYYNPALRAGGELTFTLHNQQIVGDKIYISQYHGGIVVVDAREAFEGKNVRPKETAIYLPSDGDGRPIPPDAGGIIQDGHFVTGFIDYRPLVWDTMYANGHILIPDMTGGLTVVREHDAPPAAPAAPVAGPTCTDRQGPSARFSRAKLTRRGVTLKGRATDRGCGKVANVTVAIAKASGKRCRFLASTKRFTRARSCRRPVFLRAKGTTRWSYSLKAKLGRGRYVVIARATDTAGNRSRLARRSARAR